MSNYHLSFRFEIGQIVECVVGVPPGSRMIGVITNRGWSQRDYGELYWVLMDGELKHFSHNFLREVRDGR